MKKYLVQFIPLYGILEWFVNGITYQPLWLDFILIVYHSIILFFLFNIK